MIILPSAILPLPNWVQYFIFFSSLTFHLMNKLIFGILIIFKKILRKLYIGLGILLFAFVTLSTLNLQPNWPDLLIRFFTGRKFTENSKKPKVPNSLTNSQKLTLLFIFGILLFQIAFPLR